MYVIREKKTKKVLHMQPSYPGEDLDPKAVYSAFDPAAMELGRSEEPGIPAWFDIKNGKVVPLESPEPETKASAGPARVTAPEVPLDEFKARVLAMYSEKSLELRRELVPDYQVQNAALGLYDEKQAKSIRETVKGFRDEFYRIKGIVEKAKSAKDLQSLRPAFPKKIAVGESPKRTR